MTSIKTDFYAYLILKLVIINIKSERNHFKGKINKMNLRVITVILIYVFFSTTVFAQKTNYPKTKQVTQIDEYHGIEVADPYRWLEDNDSAETKEWIKIQNKFTNDYLNTISERNKIKKRLTELWDYERYSPPTEAGGKYFYFKNDGLQDQSVLYVANSLDHVGRVLLDPNKLSGGGTIALSDLAVSPNGNFIAYGLSTKGSDWKVLRFRDVKTGKDFSEILKNIKQSNTSWTRDNKGVFYLQYPDRDEKADAQKIAYNKKLYYHKIGIPQSEDVLIYEYPEDPQAGMDCAVSDDGRWLIIYVGKAGAGNAIFYKDLLKEGTEILPLVEKFDGWYGFLGSKNSTLYFRTSRNAPNRKIIAVDVSQKDKTWHDIIPETDEPFRLSSIVNNQIIIGYLQDAHDVFHIYDLNGKFIGKANLPGIGSVRGFNGSNSDTETFYSFTNFATPPTIYRYNLKTDKNEIFRSPELNFKPENFEVKQIFYNSKDGTKVPMFIVHKKGIKLGGNNPTLLYGYGAYNSSQTPRFSAANIVWMEMGGIYAVANIRGGGEYGENWHTAAIKSTKQKSFDDFIAAAEWLISNKYTKAEKLAINGNSFGGLLIGATLNQRPDLFAAAIPEVGLLDVLRSHKLTQGQGWLSELGSPEKPEEFKYIYDYSPLHNINKGEKYPAVLVIAAANDDRVHPSNSYKYAAALQDAQGGEAPILIRIEMDAGHGGGSSTIKLIEEQADIFTFLMKNLGML
jgi:prolyl oligopeptidase